MVHTACLVNVSSVSGSFKNVAVKASTFIDPARLPYQPACPISPPALFVPDSNAILEVIFLRTNFP
jgi:hypothetical protein